MSTSSPLYPTTFRDTAMAKPGLFFTVIDHNHDFSQDARVQGPHVIIDSGHDTILALKR
jgi:hypothetical protein